MPASYHGEFEAIWLIALFVGIGANVGLAFIPAYIAKNKGYSFGAFWCIGFFASFVIGLIIAVCLPEKYPPYYPPYTPYGQPYGQPPYGQPYQQSGPSAQFTNYCSKCGHGIVSGDPFCPGCGNKV
jgi:hypothetical protein